MGENNKQSQLVQVVAIAGIVVMEVVNALTTRYDGVILSGLVGAIVFVVTRQIYKP